MKTGMAAAQLNQEATTFDWCLNIFEPFDLRQADYVLPKVFCLYARRTTGRIFTKILPKN